VAGALAGVAFGAVTVLLVMLATVSVGVVGLGAGSAPATFALGPEPLRTILLALAWGVVGGAVGGALRSPSSPEDAGQEPKPADDGPEARPP
jgi:hypothetical protein